MKELYFEAEMDIVEFCVDDVINTSMNWTAYPAFSTTGGLGGENEGPAGDAFL